MHENVSKQVVDSISLLEGMAHCSKRSVPNCHTQMKSIIHSKIRQLLPMCPLYNIIEELKRPTVHLTSACKKNLSFVILVASKVLIRS